MPRLLKTIAASTHRLAASHSRLAGAYLRLYRALKLFPDGNWKTFVLNSLQSVHWPSVALPPARVDVGCGIRVSMIPHCGEFDLAAHLFRAIAYEREVVAWLSSRSHDTVLEIGANVGVYSLLCAKLWPESRIYSFEPSRTAFRRLLNNLALNNCPNVVPFNCAVALQAGFIDLFEPSGHLTNGSLDPAFAAIFSDKVTPTRVPAMSGAEIKNLLPDCGRLLVKIDVEGYEPSVLRTLEPILEAKRPDLLIEVLPSTVAQLNESASLRGYRYFHLTSNGPVERDRLECGPTRDYILTPSSPVAA